RLLPRPADALHAVGRKAADLQIDTVLVGPEPRHGIVDRLYAGHGLADGDPVILRMTPGFEAESSLEQRVRERGDVAGREDSLCARSAVLVDENTVVDGDPGRRRDLVVARHADAGDDAIGQECSRRSLNPKASRP